VYVTAEVCSRSKSRSRTASSAASPKASSQAPTIREVRGVSIQGQRVRAAAREANSAAPTVSITAPCASSATRSRRDSGNLSSGSSPGTRRCHASSTTVDSGITTYTPVQNQAANEAKPAEPKWNRSRCSTVARSVSAVNMKIVRTPSRACAHASARRICTTSTVPAPYPAPRKAAVRGGRMVQAKYLSVCSASTNNAMSPARVSTVNASSNPRIPGWTCLIGAFPPDVASPVDTAPPRYQSGGIARSAAADDTVQRKRSRGQPFSPCHVCRRSRQTGPRTGTSRGRWR